MVVPVQFLLHKRSFMMCKANMNRLLHAAANISEWENQT